MKQVLASIFGALLGILVLIVILKIKQRRGARDDKSAE